MPRTPFLSNLCGAGAIDGGYLLPSDVFNLFTLAPQE